MLPWVYGFTWETGNVIFLTIFYSVAAVISATFAVATVRAFRDLKSDRIDEIRWHVDFNDLPDFAKSCRHVFSGEVEGRICRNGFDCRMCGEHGNLAMARLSTAASVGGSANLCKVTSIFGLNMPSDRLYHRGHTWVKKERDGTLTVGLDEFGKRVIGSSGQAELPKPGTRLFVNGTGWHFRNGNSKIRILSPVDGEVIAAGGRDAGFYIKVKPADDCDLRHLLKGAEIRPWMVKEVERLELILSSGKQGLTLADGGELVEDISANCHDLNWSEVAAEVFLGA